MRKRENAEVPCSFAASAPDEGWARCPRYAALPLAVLAAVLTIYAGSKNPKRGSGGARRASAVAGTVPRQPLPDDIATNAYSITDFEIDQAESTVRFSVRWAEGLFDYTLTRNLYLYASTNLGERQWALLGAFPVPIPAVSPYALTVAQTNVFEAMRPRFLDTFDGIGFYRFDIDLDSDGDGLSDSQESGLGTDPHLEDTDGDGVSDGVEVNIHGTNPTLPDTDGDGLTDFEELLHGTSPNNSDTDGDGLFDGWEVANFLNPLSAEGNDGATADIDHDGLTNLEEQSAGSNPRNPDTDGDWLSDTQEVGLGTNPALADTDGDGLLDGFECTINSNPLQPDSDSDGMNDGWEYQHRNAGFDPSVDNAVDANPDNDFGADPDGDSLTNGQECEWNTNPSGMDEDEDGVADGYDTDGDGVNDGAEVGQYSDPRDGGDEGVANSRVPVPFYFGDPSSSCSEKYRLEILPVSGIDDTPSAFSWLNANYGQCESRTAMLKPGWTYEVRQKWASCRYPLDGISYPNYDYTLSLGQNVPQNVALDDPDSLFRTDYYGSAYYGASHFPVLDAVANLSVYKVTGVTICKPNDSSWAELEESRVVLDDEEMRIKIVVAPQLNSLAQCRQLFGDSLTVKTAETCPMGVSMPINEDAVITNLFGRSEIRITKTCQQLRVLGVLPSADEDGINEMAWLDMANPSSGSGQSLMDSEAFAGISYEDRGRASRESSLTLASTPPHSVPSESYFKAAGREIITVSYDGVGSAKRQIMNQADYFYYSGHGYHSITNLQGNFTPAMARAYWNRDLDVAVIAACSILDINDYNGNYSGTAHTVSPGKAWEQTGPAILLGYNHVAPGDAGGAPERIMQFWVANRSSLGDVDAWMAANASNNAWNACAIVKDQKYFYFTRKWFRHVVKEKAKEEW